jgi:hypothetical protein
VTRVADSRPNRPVFFAAPEKYAIRQVFGLLTIRFDVKRQHRETFFEPIACRPTVFATNRNIF